MRAPCFGFGISLANLKVLEPPTRERAVTSQSLCLHSGGVVGISSIFSFSMLGRFGFLFFLRGLTRGMGGDFDWRGIIGFKRLLCFDC